MQIALVTDTQKTMQKINCPAVYPVTRLFHRYLVCVLTRLFLSPHSQKPTQVVFLSLHVSFIPPHFYTHNITLTLYSRSLPHSLSPQRSSPSELPWLPACSTCVHTITAKTKKTKDLVDVVEGHTQWGKSERESERGRYCRLWGQTRGRVCLG